MAEQNQTNFFSQFEDVTPVTSNIQPIPQDNQQELTLPKKEEIVIPQQETTKDFFSQFEDVQPKQEVQQETPKDFFSQFEDVGAISSTTPQTIYQPDKYSTQEKIRYGIDKQNTFFGNVYRVAKAGVQAAFDPDKDFKDYIKYNFELEQLKLKQKYGDLASGAYDDDSTVKAAAMATMLVDPFYIAAYMTPWGRAASASYKGISAMSGVTVGLDTMLQNLATTGNINPKQVGISAASAAVLGPLTVKAFRGIQQLLPTAKSKDIQNIIGVIEGQKAKDLGISQTQFKKLQTIAGDKEILQINKQLSIAGKNWIKPFETETKLFNATEKSLQSQIKKLKAEKAATKGKTFLYKNKYIEQLENKIATKKETLADKAEAYKLAQKAIWNEASKNSKQVTDLLSKRDFLYLKKIKQQQGLTRNVAEAVISASIRPVLGGATGYTFGKLWGGDDANLNNWMMVGASLGGLNKLIQRSGTVFATGEKNFLEEIIYNNATRNLFQMARELTSTTTLTKLKAFGGGAEKIGTKLFQEIDSPIGKFSSAAISDNIRQKYSLRITNIIKGASLEEQSAAIRLVRGSGEKASTKVKSLATNLEDFLQSFKDEYNSVGIGLRKYKVDRNGDIIKDKKGNAITVRIDDIKDYFPRVWNWDVVKKDPEKFKTVVAGIFESQGYKNPKVKAESFYSTLETSNEQGFYNAEAVRNLVNNLIGKPDKKFYSPIIKGLPLSDHITKDRVLSGSYAQVEKILEKNGYLVNEIQPVLNKLVVSSADSIAFAKNFGPKGELLNPYLQEIVQKYAGNANAASLASKEIGLVMKNIDAFLGRYGQVRQGIVRTGTGILSTISNLNMLDRVTIASLGDLVQPFQNSTNFTSWIKGLARTAFTQEGEKGLAKQAGFAQGKEAQQSLLKTLTPLDDATNAAKVMGSSGVTRKINEVGFKVMGLQWLTGFARRYAYNTGAVDAFTSAKNLANYAGRGNSLNTSKGIRLVNEVEKYGINTTDALKLGLFKNFDEAISKKFGKDLLNQAGVLASNRDALIPQVSNRLLFTQSRDPLVRLLGQFMSWTLAKSAQTNKILTRIENGDVKQLVKLLAALPVYGGIQQLREIAKYGEVQTDLETQTDKWYAEALRLSGISGTAPELVIGRLSGPGAREPWYLFAPFFSILTDTGDVAKETYKGNTDKATQIFLERIAPLPTWRKWIGKLFPDSDIITSIPKSTVNKAIGFNTGGEVIMPERKPTVKNATQEAEQAMTEGSPKYYNESGKEISLQQMQKEIADERKQDMKMKDAAKIATAAVVATGIGSQMDMVMPKKKPAIEINYSKVPELEPYKKEFLFDAAEKIYKTNIEKKIPDSVLLAIAAHESGWGTSRFYKEGNNYFNTVKEGDEEFIQAKQSKQKVSKHATPEENVQKLLTWIETKPHYQVVRDALESYNQGEATKNDIIDAIAKTGFAQDTKWSIKVKDTHKNRIEGKNKKELEDLYTSLFSEK